MLNKAVGLGTLDAKIIFYIRNCPPLAHYQNLTSVKALVTDEIADIALETGNHWRKFLMSTLSCYLKYHRNNLLVGKN